MYGVPYGLAYGYSLRRVPRKDVSGSGGSSGTTPAGARVQPITSRPWPAPVGGPATSTQVVPARSSFPSQSGKQNVPAGGARVTPAQSTLGPSRSPILSFLPSRAEPSIGRTVLTPQEFSNEWLYGLYSNKEFTLRLTESYVRKAWPVGLEVDLLAYLKRHVKIEGTPDTPETFTTNVDKLATMQTGAPYPTFTDTGYVYVVEFQDYQGGKPYLVTQPSVSGGNITFTAAVDYQGNPSGDGYFYSDVIITLQAS